MVDHKFSDLVTATECDDDLFLRLVKGDEAVDVFFEG